MAQLPPQQEMAEEVKPLGEGLVSEMSPSQEYEQGQSQPCDILNIDDENSEARLQAESLKDVIQIEEVKITLDNRPEDNNALLSQDQSKSSILIVTKEQIEAEDLHRDDAPKETVTQIQSLEGGINLDPNIVKDSSSSIFADLTELMTDSKIANNVLESSIVDQQMPTDVIPESPFDSIISEANSDLLDLGKGSKDSSKTSLNQQDAKILQEKAGDISSIPSLLDDSQMARMDEKFGMKEIDVETLVKESLPISPENKLDREAKEEETDVSLKEHSIEATPKQVEDSKEATSTFEDISQDIPERQSRGTPSGIPTPEKSAASHVKTYSPRSTPPSTPSKKTLKKDGMTAAEKTEKGPKKSGPAGASKTTSTSPKKSTMKNGLASPAKTPTSSETKKLPPIKAPVGLAPSPNIKEVKSKIGSMDNIKHKPKGGERKVVTQKLEWNTTSKIGSLENATHKAGGGEKKIISQKLNFKEKAQSKIGSLDNATHKPGGGNVKIEDQKLDFKVKAQSRIGSLDNVKHKAGGGDVKIRNEKLNFKEKAQPKIGSIPSSEKGSTHGSETQSTGNSSPPPDMAPLAENGEFKV